MDLQTRLHSKYLPAINDNDVESSDEDDCLPSFVIDTRPNRSDVLQSDLPTSRSVEPGNEPLRSKPVNEGSGPSLKTGLDIPDIIGDKPRDAAKVINSYAQADQLYQENCIINKDLSHEPSAYRVSRRQRKKQNKAEAEKTAGPNWYNMQGTELTEEVKNDLAIMQMRDALDRKRFYKRNSNLQKISKHFQIGTVVGTHADYYNSLPAKARKRTLVDELLEDAELRAWNKRKYSEIVSKNPYYLRKQRRAARKNNPDHKNLKKERREERQTKRQQRKANRDRQQRD